MSTDLVLAVNCGSSSLKLGLYREQERVARVAIEDLGGEARVRVHRRDGAEERAIEAADHRRAFEQALACLPELAQAPGLALGHRIVHGGTLRESTAIDGGVIRAIRAQLEVVPLHNGPALEAIEAASAAFGPRATQVAVFDTQFHAQLPQHAARYALPAELTEEHRLERVGFHGLAHRWMSERWAQLSERASRSASVVTLQLGNGCSAAAVRAGRSLDVTMGYSPLEGLMMGTRCGDVDPTLVLRLAELEGLATPALETLLNTRSGLLGVSGKSHDMRVLLAAEKAGDARCALAVEMFVQRTRKAIGAMLAALGGADAVVFGGGVGENCAEIRARVCAGFSWCGLELDRDANANASGSERRISAGNAALEAWVLPVDEEKLIVRETREVLLRAG